MKTQEVMLNDNINLNFQYQEELYKVRMNIRNGIIIVKKLSKDGDESKDETKGIIMLNTDSMPIQEAQIVEVKEIPIIEEKESEKKKSGRRKSSKSTRKKNREIV